MATKSYYAAVARHRKAAVPIPPIEVPSSSPSVAGAPEARKTTTKKSES